MGPYSSKSALSNIPQQRYFLKQLESRSAAANTLKSLTSLLTILVLLVLSKIMEVIDRAIFVNIGNIIYLNNTGS